MTKIPRRRGRVVSEWKQTPLPDGTIRITKRNRINPLTGKPYPADMPADEIETYHASRQVVADARAESNRWDNEPCVCDTDFTCMATEHDEAE